MEYSEVLGRYMEGELYRSFSLFIFLVLNCLTETQIFICCLLSTSPTIYIRKRAKPFWSF